MANKLLMTLLDHRAPIYGVWKLYDNSGARDVDGSVHKLNSLSYARVYRQRRSDLIERRALLLELSR